MGRDRLTSTSGEGREGTRERITETELLYWETRGGPQLRLVTEVRRLRGIVLSSARQVKGSPPRHEDLSQYFDVLIAEADAIQAELLLAVATSDKRRET